LEITVLFLGIHKGDPDIYIGFSMALHLQCNHEIFVAGIFTQTGGINLFQIYSYRSIYIERKTVYPFENNCEEL
jgi:hypothetical protein